MICTCPRYRLYQVGCDCDASRPERQLDAERRARAAKREALSKLPLTAEEKTRWSAAMHRTWHAIAGDLGDVGRMSGKLIVELVCDANRVQEYGGMHDAEYAFLSAIYSTPRFQRWAVGELKGYA